MYLEHFGLTKRPFDLNPDPSFLYFSSQHRLAYSMLEFGLLSQPGITVISGEVGSGKTTLLRHLMDSNREDSLLVGLLADTDEDTAAELHRWVAMAFGLDHTPDKITLKKNFQDFLIRNYAQGKTTVLIIDEAQNLGLKALEQLRLLNNINTAQDELLKIILVGQPQLVDLLRNPELMQFAQRVSVEYHLDPLAVEEASKYIRHRLHQAGGENEIFDDASIYAIFFFSGGIPRLINVLCEYALVYAYSKELQKLGVQAILDVVQGRRIGGIAWIRKVSDDMEIARKIVLEKTGLDLGDLVEEQA